MNSEELEAIRAEQTAKRAQPGVYGPWARSRRLAFGDIKRRIDQGAEFVLRLRVDAEEGHRVRIHDLIRGVLDFPASDLDTVLLKSDGLPTYHFAHVVDELLMRINLVLRGDEWVSSLPLHVRIHEAVEAPLPQYAHFGPIAKMEGSSRRKLSKRKDPEAAMSYYYEKGYPNQAVIDYLLSLASSSFEEWRLGHPSAHFTEFALDIDRLGKASMLFDFDKLVSISKDVIAGYTAEEVYARLVAWAEAYHPAVLSILLQDPEYCCKVLNVGRNRDTPRKDLAKWEDFEKYYGFFLDPLFEPVVRSGYPAMPELRAEDVVEILGYFLDTLPVFDSKDEDGWLGRFRKYAVDNHYALRRKDYEKDPKQYRGWFGDIMMVLRVALSGKTSSPELVEMIEIMGLERVERRLTRARQHFAGAKEP